MVFGNLLLLNPVIVSPSSVIVPMHSPGFFLDKEHRPFFGPPDCESRQLQWRRQSDATRRMGWDPKVQRGPIASTLLGQLRSETAQAELAVGGT